ncbi:MAG: YjbQ family protein [Clostridia bacterium]|nr:YjbQ family protein [Clostridia bacterium]
MLFEYVLKTSKMQEFVNLDHYLKDAIEKSNIKSGKLLVYCPHTTAGITINENGDPDVKRDIIETLNQVYPIHGNYKHFEGNSHAHIKSSLMGVEKQLIVHEGKCILGTWQSVYFCEFDGPRTRKIYVLVEAI